MKILIITETLYEGGSELFSLRLARGLIKAGMKVTVLSLNRSYENKMITREYEDVPVKRLSLPFLPVFELLDKLLFKLRIDFSLKYFFQGRQIVKATRGFDIVHSDYIQVDHLLSVLKKKISCRHVVTIHGDYSAQYDSFKNGTLGIWLSLDKKLILLERQVDHWVVISDEQKDFLDRVMNIPAHKISKIYNGMNQIQNMSVRIIMSLRSHGFQGTCEQGLQLLIDVFLNTRRYQADPGRWGRLPGGPQKKIPCSSKNSICGIPG
jgi:glycosyltransferase involved in cell wall biosynthesis